MSLCFRYAGMFAAILFAGLLTSSLQAQEAAKPAQAPAHRGTRFQIAASMKADPASKNTQEAYAGGQATITAKIRISAHATEADFFGEVSERFSDFAPDKGATERWIWREEKCHQKRGFPKITVVAVDGTITTEKGSQRIEARPRKLGLKLPQDEISQGARMPPDADRSVAVAFRSRTETSRLFVDVRVFAFDCDLPAGENFRASKFQRAP